MGVNRKSSAASRGLGLNPSCGARWALLNPSVLVPSTVKMGALSGHAVWSCCEDQINGLYNIRLCNIIQLYNNNTIYIVHIAAMSSA